MALTYSEKIPLGSPAPDFKLKGTADGQTEKVFALKDFRGSKAVLVAFICKHCPYIVAMQGRLTSLAKEYASRGFQVVAINSNDTVKYPEDSFENMKLQHREQGFNFPYLIDETQQVAKDYGAVCTPDLYLFDGDFKLRYHGRFDDNWKEPEKVKVQDMRMAVEDVLTGRQVNLDQQPSMGCSIKWKF